VSICAEFKRADIVFWDFDGVIKESTKIKTEAYVALFCKFGENVTKKIKNHHMNFAGVSRFEKIPLYMSWAKESLIEENKNAYLEEYSNKVCNAVIQSEWVSGVKEYLLENCSKQYFLLVTATPQFEIENILRKLEIIHCFKQIYGHPHEKSKIVAEHMEFSANKNKHAIYIGDSLIDLRAARMNGVTFFLRRTDENADIERDNNCLAFDDFK
jgi:phosphoglycolate phosphatase-like HAD superfamily hydrolase